MHIYVYRIGGTTFVFVGSFRDARPVYTHAQNISNQKLPGAGHVTPGKTKNLALLA